MLLMSLKLQIVFILIVKNFFEAKPIKIINIKTKNSQLKRDQIKIKTIRTINQKGQNTIQTEIFIPKIKYTSKLPTLF